MAQEFPYDHCWTKHTVALMSDGVILEKRSYKYSDGSAPHSTAWTVRRRKVREGVTTEHWVKCYVDSGYVQVKK